MFAAFGDIGCDCCSGDPGALELCYRYVSSLAIEIEHMGEPNEDLRRYFQVHGLEVQSPAALNQSLALAIKNLRPGLYTESATALSAQETDLLRRGGLDPKRRAGRDPLGQTAVEFAALLHTSLDAGEAATRLGVHQSRVRQMLKDRTLYGFRIDHRWRIPAFQFLDGDLVPNITQVNVTLDPALHPVAVHRWYTTPEADLEDEHGRSLSPLDWLIAGYSIEPILRAAAGV
jgi:hypothetical protein